MTAVILTEGGRGAGFGHITRCIALAQAMNRRGVKVKLFINADKSVKAILNKEKIKYVASDWIKDKNNIITSTGRTDLIIVDSYLAEADFYNYMYNSKLRPLISVIDDYNRIDYNADVLINPSIYGNKIKYKKKHNITYLTGKEYIILRKEFWSIPVKHIKRNIGDVLITLGGSKHNELSAQILRHLKMVFPCYRYHLVTSSPISFPSDRTVIHYSNISADKMKSLMLKTDIAISGGGQTLYELARLCVPTICVRLSENQTVNTKGLQKEGFLRNTLHYKDKKLLNDIVLEITSLQSKGARRNRARIGRRLVDGRGADRIARELMKLKEIDNEISLRPVTMADCDDVLLWRNHEEVRKWCFTSNIICAAEHKKWFAEAIKSRDGKIYIAVNNAGDRMGQVRLNIDRNKNALINVNLNPKFIGKGFGSKIIGMGTRLLLEKNPGIIKVQAEIISANAASKKAFRNAGYILSRCVVKHNKHVSIFEYER